MTDFRDWKTAVSTDTGEYESYRRYADCGISGVEISRGWQDHDSIDWAVFKANADRAGIEILSYHLPFANEINIASLDPDARQYAVSRHAELMGKAAGFGVKRFIVHPSAEPIEDCDRKASMEAAKKSLAQMAEYADTLGAEVCVEDLPRTCLGHNAEEMLELLSADARLRVCFDVNHLLPKYGCMHADFVKAVGDRIVTVHMSDYDFIDERHLFPGIGDINWKEVVELLEAADYNGPFLYEGGFAPSHFAPDKPYGKIEDAHSRHMNIKQFTGK